MSDQTEIIIKLTVDEEQLDTLRLYQPSDARPVEEDCSVKMSRFRFRTFWKRNMVYLRTKQNVRVLRADPLVSEENAAGAGK